MRALIAVVLVLVAVVAVVLALRFFPSSSTPPAAPRPPVRTPAPQSLQTPVAVVTSYLQALDRKDYRKAYDFLSADSRQLHPYDDFAARAEEAGSTDYDVAKAAEEPGAGNSVVVAVPMLEDPAKAGFNLVKEDGAWKVVFISGTPAFPYAEQAPSDAGAEAGKGK